MLKWIRERGPVQLNWNEKLQNIIDYVEDHLQSKEEPVNNDEIAKMAECSFDFFQKVFSYMNGISFAEYVRCRKLTLAGYDLKSTGMFGLFGYYDEASCEIEYLIMVRSDGNVPRGVLPDGFTEIVLPETTWAVFDCVGMIPQLIQKGWKYLNEEWMVKYPFKHAPCPELEWYSDGNSYSTDYLSQIWIPVIEED